MRRKNIDFVFGIWYNTTKGTKGRYKMENISPTIQAAIRYAIESSASDLHLKTANSPAVRINGEIVLLDMDKLKNDEILAFADSACGDVCINKDDLRAVDFSWEYNGTRFRCNLFCDSLGYCISMRLLTIPSTDFKALGIPEILKKLVERKSGLILVTGPTGSGKTTTLTCLIDYINSTRSSHIITLEDPIEFVHHSKKCLISQREIGITSVNYTDAIVEALREDPDIVFIGEMRDKESIAGALRAAETGHLVLSTLHTKGAANTITRIVDVFPPEQQDQVRMQLSLSLVGVISQQLIPRCDVPGRVLATEIMIGTVPIQSLIRQQKIHMINSTLENSSGDGMHTMKKSLEQLYALHQISKSDFENYQIV